MINGLTRGGGRSHDGVVGELANGEWVRGGGSGIGLWHFECKRGLVVGSIYSGMRTVWEDEGENLIHDAGWNSMLDVYLRNQTQIASWFVGLTAASPTPAAGDTLPTHGGWTEFSSYSGTRKAYTAAAAASRSINNSASKASFTMTAGGTVGGGFLCSVTSGTSGTLFSTKALTGGDRAVLTSDVLDVTVTYTMTST